MPNIKPCSHWLLAAVVGVAALSSGCALTQQASTSPYHDYSNLNYLPETLSQQLQTASAGQQFVATESPWGGNASIYVQERYFSASGRTCVKLSINASQNNVIACQYQQQWVLNPDILLSASQG